MLKAIPKAMGWMAATPIIGAAFNYEPTSIQAVICLAISSMWLIGAIICVVIIDTRSAPPAA